MATFKIIINHAGCSEDVLTVAADLSEQAVADIFNQFTQSVLGASTGCDFDDPIVTLDDIQRVTANGRLYWYEMEAFLIDIYKTN